MAAFYGGAVATSADLFESRQPSHCPVSKDTGRLSQDIMDRPASVEGLVVTGWVNGQSAEELPLLGHDSDLSASNKDVAGFVPVSGLAGRDFDVQIADFGVRQ